MAAKENQCSYQNKNILSKCYCKLSCIISVHEAQGGTRGKRRQPKSLAFIFWKPWIFQRLLLTKSFKEVKQWTNRNCASRAVFFIKWLIPMGMFTPVQACAPLTTGFRKPKTNIVMVFHILSCCQFNRWLRKRIKSSTLKQSLNQGWLIQTAQRVKAQWCQIFDGSDLKFLCKSIQSKQWMMISH